MLRRFAASNTVAEVRAFVSQQMRADDSFDAEDVHNFTLKIQFSDVNFDDFDATLQSLGLKGSVAIIVAI